MDDDAIKIGWWNVDQNVDGLGSVICTIERET